MALAGELKKSPDPRSPRSQSAPFSPSCISLSPSSPRTPASHDSETVKSPGTRKSKSLLSPLPRRNPSRFKSGTDVIENREKSPTESFFEFMEKEKKSSEVMQLLELATKQQKTATPSVHMHIHPTPALVAEATEKGVRPGPSKTASSKATSKKPSKQSTFTVKGTATVSVTGPALKGSAVEVRTLSRDSMPHSPPTTQTAAELGLVTPATLDSSKGGREETQLNNSDSVEEMDTSNELEGGGGYSLSPTNEGTEEDVVHCVCGSIEDEGFMIQVREEVQRCPPCLTFCLPSLLLPPPHLSNSVSSSVNSVCAGSMETVWISQKTLSQRSTSVTPVTTLPG